MRTDTKNAITPMMSKQQTAAVTPTAIATELSPPPFTGPLFVAIELRSSVVDVTTTTEMGVGCDDAVSPGFVGCGGSVGILLLGVD